MNRGGLFFKTMKKIMPITLLINKLSKYNEFVFLDSSLSDKKNKQSFVFLEPHKLICCYKLSDLKSCLRTMQKEKENGNYLAGFISYEAGYSFCQKLHSAAKYDFPLIWMGVFKKVSIYDHNKGCFLNDPIKLETIAASKNSKSCQITDLRLNISKKDYIRNVNIIKGLIAAGDTYQVNYTTKIKFNLKGTDLALYQKLRDNQPVGYSAFIKSKQFSILSYSPELFFRKTKKHICVQPMKGTMPRGLNTLDDKKMQKFLRNDPKNRAENIMIVDLLRNDLGKISKISSVQTTRMFQIEKYKTLLQMTSTVESELKKEIDLYDLFSSLHPCGSVTGAPKIHTMEIIKQLEPEERKIYTGSIGYISPDDNAVFNVAIRTILLNRTKGEMGIGGGITYNSSPESEWAETKLKAKFLTQKHFKLIETMLLSKKTGIFLFELHLKRLKQSAEFFGFPCSLKKIKAMLHKKTNNLPGNQEYKLRLLLNNADNVHITISAITKIRPKASSRQIIICPHRINKHNPFLYHKTTCRSLYNRQLNKYKKFGFYDILFLNRNKQVCEGAISNVFIKKSGIYYTPPINCGMLPGVFREYFIKQNKKVREKILYIEDLKKADVIYCANSVKGMVRVRLA